MGKSTVDMVIGDCGHTGQSKGQIICDTLVCPKCYYHMLMNPTEREKKQFEKNVYARLIYIWDESKHMPVPEIVYPGDSRYDTGSRTIKGVKPPHE